MTEKELSSLKKRKSKGNCATFVAKDDTRLMQWRVAFAQRYSSDHMIKCAIQFSFGQDIEEPVIKLKREKDKTAVLTIHVYRNKTIMIQCNHFVLNQWIDKEFPVLAKHADDDDLNWNNSWLKSEEDKQKPPLSPERKEEIREKARQARNKKDDETDNL